MSSLTSPYDKKNTALTESEMNQAMNYLYETDITDKFPRIEKLHADPIYLEQRYCLHSFIPSSGAFPDEDGLFGFMKCRGTFHNIEEANNRAEWIIRNCDSYHPIQTGYVGRPFPICTNTKKYVSETHEVDIRKKAVEVISEDIKQKRLKEKQEIDDIKEREKRLLDESKEDFVEDPLDAYITLQVKKANLVFTYVKTQEKLDEIRENIKKSYKQIREMDKENHTFREQYFERYRSARAEVGMPTENSEENFIKYMVEDAELDFEY